VPLRRLQYRKRPDVLDTARGAPCFRSRAIQPVVEEEQRIVRFVKLNSALTWVRRYRPS